MMLLGSVWPAECESRVHVTTFRLDCNPFLSGPLVRSCVSFDSPRHILSALKIHTADSYDPFHGDASSFKTIFLRTEFNNQMSLFKRPKTFQYACRLRQAGHSMERLPSNGKKPMAKVVQASYGYLPEEVETLFAHEVVIAAGCFQHGCKVDRAHFLTILSSHLFSCAHSHSRIFSAWVLFHRVQPPSFGGLRPSIVSWLRRFPSLLQAA